MKEKHRKPIQYGHIMKKKELAVEIDIIEERRNKTTQNRIEMLTKYTIVGNHSKVRI